MKMIKLRSLIFAAFLALPFASSFAQVEFSVGWAPPPLPVVEQPPCPVAGYLWTPGYWGWNADYYDYYWVPGVWVPPPRVGLLWTPPWWGWRNGVYAFNQGYWGPTVGFYGGVNYGFGYTGNGYWGGRWSGNNFQYNTAVTHVNKTVINNTYVNNSFARNVNANRTSFNGGNGGIKAEPNAEQRKAMANADKVGPTSQQLNRQQAAGKDKNLLASTNKGKPNHEAIKSFNKAVGAGQGKGGAEALGAAAGAGAGKGENKIGNASELNRQGAGQAGQGQGGKGLGAEAAAGKGGNKPGNVTERHAQGPGGGGENAKKLGAESQANKQRNLQGNQAKAHTGKMGGAGGHPGQPHGMNQMASNPQMGARNAQMGGQRQFQTGGGNRPGPKGQQPQGKKKKEDKH
jgi:hypothetical protein